MTRAKTISYHRPRSPENTRLWNDLTCRVM